MGAPGPHRELQPGREVGHLGALPGARGRRPDDVRPDDRRLLDLHRDPGDPPGDVRDVRRARPPALRRHPPRDGDADRRPRRDGRGPAPGRDDERRGGDLHRGRREPGPAAARDRLRRPARPPDPDEALALARGAAAEGLPLSIALIGNAAEIEPAWAKAGERFDVVTDQTSAHDPLGGYVPAEIDLGDAIALRTAQPDLYIERSMRSMAAHVRAMLEFQRAGAVVFDYGNNLRAMAREAGRRGRLRLPRVRAGLHPAALLRGQRALPLGRIERRSGRHPAHRPRPDGALPG